MSAARGHLTPEVASPVDGATVVSYSCFRDTFHLSFTVSAL
jgi:hypothetical protein